jgi:hypothetical protein
MWKGAYDQASWHLHAAHQPVVGTPGQPQAFTEVPSGPGLGQCLNLQTTQISLTAVQGSVSQNVRTCLEGLLGGALPIHNVWVYNVWNLRGKPRVKATCPHTPPSGRYFCFYFLCMHVLPERICPPCVCLVPVRGHQIPWTQVLCENSQCP